MSRLLPQLEGDFRKSNASKALALLRFPLALIVVAAHWFSQELIPGCSEASAYPLTAQIFRLRGTLLADTGIIVFFFISGYLFFAGSEMNRSIYLGKLQKRVWSLLIPYLLWNIIYWGLYTLPGAIIHGAQPDILAGFFKGMLFKLYPHNPVMWFIRELMICVLLVPVTLPLLRRRYGWILFPAIGTLCIFSVLAGNQYMPELCEAYLYFSIGAWVSLRRYDFTKIGTAAKWCAFAGLLVVWAVTYLFSEFTPLHRSIKTLIIGLPWLVTILSVATWFVTHKGVTANSFLTASTFFLFAAHFFFIAPLAKLLHSTINPPDDLRVFFTMLGGYVLLVALVLGIYAVLRKLWPRCASLLTGKRN